MTAGGRSIRAGRIPAFVCAALLYAVSLPAQSRNPLPALNRDPLLTQNRDSLLIEYLGAMEALDIPAKIAECDFILGSCDSASREETALKVFTHFRESKLMGDENVAVYVADKWILGGELADSTLAEIRSYAEFNRPSLLGVKAPTLPEAGLDGFDGEKMSVLWFYDTDCPKCRLETVLLEDFAGRHPECGIIAFYVGDDLEKWEAFRREHFKTAGQDCLAGRYRPGGVGQVPECGQVRHLCDPSGDSDFRRKYSVTATPRMFLIDREGTIIGRMLDTESLELLLAERAKREKAAVTELFYQMVPLRGEDAKNSLEYLIDNYILCENSHFDTAEDTLMVVNFARIQKELLSKARPGTKIAAVKVKGSLNGRKPGVRRLDRLGDTPGRLRPKSGIHEPEAHKSVVHESGIRGKGEKDDSAYRTVIIFHTNGCNQCKAELEAAGALGINTFAIDIDEIQKESPETFDRLLDSFDLTTLPLLVETGRDGVILRRCFSLAGE